jgi:hypothetical protein
MEHEYEKEQGFILPSLLTISLTGRDIISIFPQRTTEYLQFVLHFAA